MNILGAALPAPVVLAPIGVSLSCIGRRGGGGAGGGLGRRAIDPQHGGVEDDGGGRPGGGRSGQVRAGIRLYWGRDPELTASFLARAERAGYSAIVATLDTPLLAWRERDIALAYCLSCKARDPANYLSDPVFRASLARLHQRRIRRRR